MQRCTMSTYSKMLWIKMLAGLAAFPMLACGQDFNLSPTFTGHAVALQVNQLGGDSFVLADTGPAPARGGQSENSLRDTPPNPVVDAHLLYAVTVGGGSRNRSHASLSFVSMKLGSHYVTALWVESEATATGEFLNVASDGKSDLQ